jgi:hypothetical protein
MSLAQKRYSLVVRRRDYVVEEIATLLRSDHWYEFNPLFELARANLRGRKPIRAGEEMLRLRLYEKLQRMVELGFVSRDGARYRGIPQELSALSEYMAERFQEREAVA